MERVGMKSERLSQIQTLPVACCVALGKLPNLSEPVSICVSKALKNHMNKQLQGTWYLVGIQLTSIQSLIRSTNIHCSISGQRPTHTPLAPTIPHMLIQLQLAVPAIPLQEELSGS